MDKVTLKCTITFEFETDEEYYDDKTMKGIIETEKYNFLHNPTEYCDAIFEIGVKNLDINFA